ncbi:MAG TPA: hypothetical protein PKA90_01065 [Ignavibacteria bacterium]|nr:hypothetical protein [Ignavibacteria bacterium]HMR38996.1 hypothetical protein [Ignavibacteria bacterium]
MIRLIVTFTFLFLLSNLSFAQNKSSSIDFKKYLRKPSIEISYGLSGLSINGNDNNLANAGMIEMKLGFTKQNISKYGKNIINYRNNYLFLRNASSDNYSRSDNPGLSNDMWSFGVGDKKGYGVKTGNFSILPYSSNSFAWTQLTYDQTFATPDEIQALADFDGSFRFGTSTEAGINFQITQGFSIQPKYEISDVYPRSLFGKQLMSSVIEYSGLFLIDGFTRQIMKNTPVAGSFVNFVLRNAYEYGFYQLRKNQMNWPFTSVAPLRYNTFKLGMTFTF